MGRRFSHLGEKGISGVAGVLARVAASLPCWLPAAAVAVPACATRLRGNSTRVCHGDPTCMQLVATRYGRPCTPCSESDGTAIPAAAMRARNALAASSDRAACNSGA